MGEHNGVSTSTMPAARGGSRAAGTTTTTRPKIKIIHIIAPEIIKTDVANFRDLVQRLTGKPAACATTSTADMASATTTAPPAVVQEEDKKETTTTTPKKRPAAPAMEKSEFAAQQEPSKKRTKIKCEVKVEEAGGFGDYCYDLDRSSDLWMDLNPGGFLSFLEEEADVFKGLAAADDFLLPLPLASSRLDLVGEMYAS